MDITGSGSGPGWRGRRGKEWFDTDSHLGRVVHGCTAYGTTQQVGQDRQHKVVLWGLIRHNFKCLGAGDRLSLRMTSGLSCPL